MFIESVRQMLTLQLQLFLLLGTGFFLRRKSILSGEGKRCLTDLLIDVVLPCNIVHSFSVDFSMDLLTSCAVVLVASVLVQVLCTFLANVVYGHRGDSRQPVLQYATVCSNAGFLGNPMVESLYGSTALLFASVYLIPQRIVMWSAGVSYFSGESNWKAAVKKVLLHPCVVGVYIGLARMFSGVAFPAFLDKTITGLSGCTTSLAMLVIGGILAETPAGEKLVDKTVTAYTALRLVGIPLLVLLACLAVGMVFPLDPMVIRVSVILAGMPAGSTTAILASKYKADAAFATRLVVFSTILSMLSLPVWYLLLDVCLR